MTEEKKKKKAIMIIASQKCWLPELERRSNCPDFGKCQNQRCKQTVCFDRSILRIKPLGDSAVTLNTSLPDKARDVTFKGHYYVVWENTFKRRKFTFIR